MREMSLGIHTISVYLLLHSAFFSSEHLVQRPSMVKSDRKEYVSPLHDANEISEENDDG